MSDSSNGLVVRSHVARDLLQNAALFKTDRLVVWEYVSNGLQYVDPGVNPVVRVTLDSKKKSIVIADNGRGMDWAGLQNFFVMHGENVDRKEGRPGRGRFGTGKSAAFGIAETLRVTTTRQHRRCKVQLNRSDVVGMRSEGEIPVRVIEREAPVAGPNGTRVEVENVHLRSLDQPGIIRYIERHLLRWPKNCSVFVNNHECEFLEPPVASERRFRAEGDWRDKLGDVTLVLKAAKAPLDDDLRGVSIFSNGVWHETTLAGSEGREMSQYIFGEVDVPKLEEDNSPISPFDLSRSMRLNATNHLVQLLYAFIGQRVEEVRRELVHADRERKASEEARRLRHQASEIAQVINQDFEEYRRRVARAKAKAAGGSDVLHAQPGGSSEGADLVFGAEFPAALSPPLETPSPSGSGNRGETPNPVLPAVTAGTPDEEKRGRPAGAPSGKRHSGGGFDVKFHHLGLESHRAVYVPGERAIYINLDHPQLAAARESDSIEDPMFRRLAYEVAFAEYAVALASELAANDEYLDPSDPIVDIRESLNRLARRAATLYSR